MAGAFALLRSLDTGRLRAVALALRRDPPTPRPRETDPSLVDRVERPFDSVDDVFRRLRDLERRLRDRDDRRAVFLTIYTRMTAAVRDAIANGRFADPDWMRRYTVTFADYYRRAFLAFERGAYDAVPAPWRVAFSTALDGSALVAQDAFLGINAHINYDLALALRDVGLSPNRDRKHEDHLRIDAVLAGLLDAQQEALADLYAPGLSTVDATLGRFDEALSLFSITEGRAQAWRVAVVLADVRLPPLRAATRWLLHATAVGGAAFVRSPPVDPAVLSALGRVERDRGPLAGVLTDFAERLDAVG
ncbi:DUF5995 family protein [Haloplanus salilacus]|uniref:DUF5995 family protein n=1 Tax=Haloplanus salilacus TaxID=2949994 RepID=UPI0030D12855